jgi:hypothetical protein
VVMSICLWRPIQLLRVGIVWALARTLLYLTVRNLDRRCCGACTGVVASSVQ